MKRILVTGAFGLVGSDLVLELQKRFGRDNVIALSHKTISEKFEGIVEKGDATKKENVERLITKYKINEIYHLAGILSAGSERDPQLAWQLNVGGLKTILDLAVERKLRIFWPSSIGAFGPTTPKVMTPQHTIMEPSKMYGVNKVTGELLCQYYFLKYGVDVRSLRYPGLIGYKAPPGDGTTEYSVHIFYHAIQDGKYQIFLKKDAELPMMYIDDAIRGTIDLMEAPSDKITVRTSYNFSAISFTPVQMVTELQKLMPKFTATYVPDERQKIADSWPRSLDDSQARTDWGWHHEYDLPKMTKIMLDRIREKLALQESSK